MNKTGESLMKMENKILISTNELKEVLSCGRATAVRIGMEAGARVQFGRRVLWKLEKLQEYFK